MEPKSVFFYFFATLPAIWEMYCLYTAREMYSIVSKLKFKISESRRGKSVDFTNSEIVYIVVNAIYLAWAALGMIGSEKIEFGLILFILVFNFRVKYVGMIVGSVASYFLLSVIIINKFSLHIDFLDYIRHIFLNH